MTAKKQVGIGAAIAIPLVIGLWLAFTPYLALNRMNAALKSGNGQALSAYIDYPALRASLKEQAAADLARVAGRRGADPARAAGAARGVNALIDVFVQPQMIVAMLSDSRSEHNPLAGRVTPQATIHRTGITTFELVGSRRGAACFEMQGLTWKLVGVRADADGRTS